MTLKTSTNGSIILNNETDPADFGWRVMREFVFSFSSIEYPLATRMADEMKRSLAAYLNSNMRGPYFVWEEENLHATGVNDTAYLHIVLFYPEDYKNFAEVAGTTFWKKNRKAAEENAAVIIEQAKSGFVLKNADLRKLVERVGALLPETGDIGQTEIEEIMDYVWTRREPVRTLFISPPMASTGVALK